MSHRRKLDKFIDESRARQRNIVFPDTVRNARAADYFLWHGSPNPLFVQRIAAWFVGLILIGIGSTFLPQAAMARDEGSWIGFGAMILASASLVMVGIRIFRNGFHKSHKPPGSN
jgi:hypothetical protein